jgi:tetratricopeptide (TPR) repeat protein
MMYTAHNYEFLAFSTAMQGRRADTIEAARKARGIITDAMLLEDPGADWYLTELYAAMVRFGMWDAILAEPAPNAKLKGLTGGYLHARAIAQAATGRVADARQSLAELQKVATAAPNPAADVLSIAVLVARARIASAEQNSDEAIALLTQAVAKEDGLPYDEPSDWFFPVRHLLGAALLQAGKARDAEAVYREDLRRRPENGWALCGLALSLKTQKRDAEAAIVQRRFERAWQDADVSITASAF